jgi:cutinase
MHNTVPGLSDAIKQKVIAGVLFGDTRNKQDNHQVPRYPKDQVMIFCDKEDGVCDGRLNVSQAHMVYMCNGDGMKAISFLKSKIDVALAKKGARV